MFEPVAFAIAPVILTLGISAGTPDPSVLADPPRIEVAQAKVKDKSAADLEPYLDFLDAEICQLSIEIAELGCPGWFCVERDGAYIYASNDGRWWFEADGRVIAEADWPDEAGCLDEWNAR